MIVSPVGCQLIVSAQLESRLLTLTNTRTKKRPHQRLEFFGIAPTASLGRDLRLLSVMNTQIIPL